VTDLGDDYPSGRESHLLDYTTWLGHILKPFYFLLILTLNQEFIRCLLKSIVAVGSILLQITTGTD
jgi:hypothetical protein